MNSLKTKVLFTSSLFLVVLLTPFWLFANPLTTWHHINPFPGDMTLYPDFNDVTYGNGIFVAVGKSGAIATSTNGVDWTIKRSAITNNLAAIAHNGKDTYVAVDASGAILTSPDGFLWTNRGIYGENLSGVTYGNNKFVVVRRDLNEVLTSPDGIAWTKTRIDFSISDIAYGNDTFVGITAQDGSILISSNGIEWSTLTPGTTPSGLRGITFGKKLFVATGEYGEIYTSPTGLTWTKKTLTPAINLKRLAFGKEFFVATGEKKTIFVSTNAEDWEIPLIDVSNLQSFKTIVYLKDKFFIIDENNHVIIFDGFSWSIRQEPDWNDLYSVAFGKDKFIAVGGSGAVMSSTDGTAWTEQNLNTNKPLKKITFINDNFIAIEGKSTVASYEGIKMLISTDGITWTEGETIFEEPIITITYGNGIYIASTGANIYHSSNGFSWFNKGPFDGIRPHAIIFDKNTFIAIGIGGIATSSDGIIWTVKDPHFIGDKITCGNNTIVAISDNSVAVSTDATVWTIISPNIELSGNAVAFGSNILVIVGNKGLIIRSEPLSLVLTPGWNFISFPYLPSASISVSTLLNDISNNVKIVWGFDNRTKRWRSFKFNAQGSMNSLNTIEKGNGYWIYMEKEGSILLSGSPSSSQTIPLYSGWNLIGYYGTEGIDSSSALNVIGVIDKWRMVWHWDKGVWYGRRYIDTTLPVPRLEVFKNGKAYWIKMDGDANWKQQ